MLRDLSNENVIHKKKDEIQYIQFRRLLEYSEIIEHSYSLGIHTNFRTENDYQKAINSYKNLCNAIDLNYLNIVRANQKHTDNVEIVDKKINRKDMEINLNQYKNTDGLITNTSNLILSTTNADCILMIFFDPITKTIANVHSGWKGTVQRICVKTVKKMINNFRCNPKDIICCICPSIRKCHFEVDIEVKQIFQKQFQELGKDNVEKIIKKQKEKEKWNIDTVLINKIILEKAGLKRENIIDSGICSVCNSDLVHSYRVEKQGYGLSTALITLK